MSTFGEMIEETRSYLRSFVRDQELSTHLVADCVDDEFTVKVSDPSVISRGRIEIGDELIWADKADKQTGLVSIPPYGRGMDGTIPSAHKAGVRVIMQPLYPVKLLKDTLNQSITAIGSQLFGVEVLSEFRIKPGDFLYPLPDFVTDVLSVKAVRDDATRTAGEVTYLREWTFDKHAPSAVGSGKGLYLYDSWYDPQSRIEVVVARDPERLYRLDQQFTDSHLPATAWDVVVLLAASRLLAGSDSGRIQTRAVGANTLDSKVPVTAAQQESKYLYTLHQQRLMEERQRLLNTFVQRTHYSR